jgi:predicted nuclease with TOPRIM domain
MREQIQTRLEELKKEFETGQNRLRELEAEMAYVRETMLRISGAIQVLEQMLQDSEQSAEAETRPRV